MDWKNILAIVEGTITGVGLRVIGAIVLYIVGRWLISFAIGLVQKGLSRQKIEPTLLRFIGNTISVVLNITLVLAILGYFGVQTTSFAALLRVPGSPSDRRGAVSSRTSRRAFSSSFCGRSR